MRAHGYSVLFGVLALVGLAFNPPIAGCFINPFFYVFAGFAGLGLVLGLAGLPGAANGEDRGLAIAGIILSVASPVVAWRIAPGTGSRNETSVIGDVRSVMAGQDAYKSANGGYYGTPECLSRPSACLRGYPETGPVFLDSTLASGQRKGGYDRYFIAGPPAKGLSPSSMTSYAYVAVPVKVGQGGVRGFCGDSEGMICMTREGQMPPVRAGRCLVDVQDHSSNCTPLR